MPGTNIANVGETAGIPAVGGDFADAVQVAIYGVETAVQRRIREEVAPRVNAIFMEAGYKLARNDDVIEALAGANLRSEFVLPRYIPDAPDAPFMMEEVLAQKQLRLMIEKIVKQENPTLDFEHADPTGAVLTAKVDEILKTLWNDERKKLSTEVKKETGRSEYFLIDVNKNDISAAQPLFVRYRADRVSHLSLQNVPKRTM